MARSWVLLMYNATSVQVQHPQHPAGCPSDDAFAFTSTHRVQGILVRSRKAADCRNGRASHQVADRIQYQYTKMPSVFRQTRRHRLQSSLCPMAARHADCSAAFTTEGLRDMASAIYGIFLAHEDLDMSRWAQSILRPAFRQWRVNRPLAFRFVVDVGRR
jgi:hypothetical protein